MIFVASYCRVSTDKEDQANSLVSQQEFFAQYISNHPQWELYAGYVDQGITGTSIKKRPQFQKMIQAATEGKFKIILTKEVSRFSRNLLDTIAYTRKLKALGVSVIFLTDGINTMELDAELRLSIMASIAQEESRKTSTRVKWGQSRQMERGVVFGRSMLGYDVKDGKISVNPDGAKLVQRIFQMYGVEKKGTTEIAKILKQEGIPTYTGNQTWSNSHLIKILKNEKYRGDLVQKKTYTPDYLSHTKKINHGEEPLIQIKNHHDPIVSPDLFDLVQEEMKHRSKKSGSGGSVHHVFSGKIWCGECGAPFVARTKKNKHGQRVLRWGCANALRFGCTPHVWENGRVLGCDVGKLVRNDTACWIATETFANLPIQHSELATAVQDVVMREETEKEERVKYLGEIHLAQDKKTAVLDAYFAKEITLEEMREMRQRYDQDIAWKTQKLSDLEKRKEKRLEHDVNYLEQSVTSVLRGDNNSCLLWKTVIDQMLVHKDGGIEVSLKHLPHRFYFSLTGQEENSCLNKDRRL